MRQNNMKNYQMKKRNDVKGIYSIVQFVCSLVNKIWYSIAQEPYKCYISEEFMQWERIKWSDTSAFVCISIESGSSPRKRSIVFSSRSLCRHAIRKVFHWNHQMPARILEYHRRFNSFFSTSSFTVHATLSTEFIQHHFHSIESIIFTSVINKCTWTFWLRCKIMPIYCCMRKCHEGVVFFSRCRAAAVEDLLLCCARLISLEHGKMMKWKVFETSSLNTYSMLDLLQ